MLPASGVEFRVCNNTLGNRSIGREKVALEAGIVPSGVVEFARRPALAPGATRVGLTCIKSGSGRHTHDRCMRDY